MLYARWLHAINKPLDPRILRVAFWSEIVNVITGSGTGKGAVETYITMHILFG